MIRKNIDLGWELSNSGRRMSHMAEAPLIVDLPHDWSIGTQTDPNSIGAGGNGYYNGASISYKKVLDIAPEWKGNRVLLELDGAYRNCEVSINGSVVKYHPYGYTAFFADITERVVYGGENLVEITVNNTALPNSRWYSGTGLYRHIDLLCLPRVGIAPWGVFAHTESIINEDVVLVVDVTAENHTGTAAQRTVRVTLKDAEEQVVNTALTQCWIPAGGENTAFVRMVVPNANLWDLDTPYLYTVEAELLDGDVVTNTITVSTGLRTVSVDAKNGFMLNGKTMKLKGGCIHHDSGILGSAAFDAAEFRKVKLHKDNGYNALRSAHNPPSRGLLEACDKLGVLVMNEAFDMWIAGKNTNDYHLDFQKWWETDIDSMVKRDRNHPSVIMWSIGNEIPEHDGSSDGWKWAQLLAARVRLNDNTRPVTSGVNNVADTRSGMTFYREDIEDADKYIPQQLKDSPTVGFFNNANVRKYNLENFFEQTEGYVAPLDVVGYNYIDYLYEETIKRYPNRVLCGTESFPLEADLQWAYVKRFPQLIGDFTWTSYDYIGEAGLGRSMYLDPKSTEAAPFMFGAGYPWRISYDADFDICGYERPQLAYRRIVWGSSETYLAVRDPKFHGWEEKISQWAWPLVHHNWSWPGREGMLTTLEVYSAAEEVELILNGVSLGKKPVGEANRFKATFTVTYAPGTLTAVSYSGGEEVSRNSLSTVGSPETIVLRPETHSLKADGQDLCYISVEVCDILGNRVPTAELLMTAEVSGEGVLQGFGSPKPDSTEVYTTGIFTTFEGRLMAVLRSGTSEGKVKLTVNCQELGTAEIVIPVV